MNFKPEIMKTIMKLALGSLLAFSTLSCKDNKSETDIETTGTTTESTDMEMESTSMDTATVVNDTNVPGTTSCEMEQVP